LLFYINNLLITVTETAPWHERSNSELRTWLPGDQSNELPTHPFYRAVMYI